VLRAVVPRPTLWFTAVGAVFRLARRGWWRQKPFLPLPGEDYWKFRVVTAYGGGDDGGTRSTGGPTPDDVVAYLRWCQRSRPRRG
jgi:hypothetical protein